MKGPLLLLFISVPPAPMGDGQIITTIRREGIQE